ncbi:VOC family protein [Jatrophihabitans sp. YIM 134969]
MAFWQLTVHADDPERLAAFWAVALDYTDVPPVEPDTTWNRHYRGRLEGADRFTDRIFDPEGLRPPVWFQRRSEPAGGAGPTQLHVDAYVTGRDDRLDQDARAALVEERVARLEELGGAVVRRTRADEWQTYWVTMTDPEGHEFCVG